MQVKKFEAPTIQEALDNIKRELGPEAIILQTKQNKKGFGLMSKGSVEVTAAVSERSLTKKQVTERRLPEEGKQAIKNMPAEKQAQVYDKYMDRHLETMARAASRDQVQLSSGGAKTGNQPAAAPAPRGSAAAYGPGKSASAAVASAPAPRPAAPALSRMAAPASSAAAAHPGESMGAGRKITATRYIDIDPDSGPPPAENARGGGRPAPIPAPAGSASTAAIEEELSSLRRMIQDFQDQGPPAGTAAGRLSALATPAFQDAYDQLLRSGIDQRYAYGLLQKVAFELGADPQGKSAAAAPTAAHDADAVLDQLASELLQSIEVASPLAGILPEATSDADAIVRRAPAVIALVGPTGVGKTTTIAKIASEALLKRNLRVGLINLDDYKVAAFDQLGTYAKILNVPFRSASTVADLRAAMLDFQSLDLVLIDTTGRSQRDPQALQEMQKMLQAVPGAQAHLVLAATTRDADLYDMAHRFSLFQPRGIITSKLDEATVYGAIYNVARRTKLPLLYFTTGQRVPEDIEEATPERVASLVLELS